MIKFQQLDARTYKVQGLNDLQLEVRQRADDFVAYLYHQPDHRWFAVATYPCLKEARVSMEGTAEYPTANLLPLYNSLDGEHAILTEDYYESETI